MKVIGIIGGIGSGKSTVVSLIQENSNAIVISADHIGHEILKKGNKAYESVIHTFGNAIIGDDGEIDRKILGGIVFGDKSKLQELNNISHPLIYKAVKDEIQKLKKANLHDYIIVDAALLIEIKLIDLVDEVWGIYTPLDIQIERLMKRNGFSREEATNRIKSQLKWEEIKKVVDVEINNSSDVENTKEQIISVLEPIKGD